MPRRRHFGARACSRVAAIVCVLAGASAHAAHGPAAVEDDTRARAKAAVAAGREAAARGDYAAALARFEEALALQPAASLHFNIAVCQHQLMLAQPQGDDAYETHRRAAIEAYGRYLDASPDADDRAAVETTIEQLGGRPEPDEPWVIERIDPGEMPSAPALRDTGGTAASPDPAAPPSAEDRPGEDVPPELAHVGRIGAFVPLSLASLVELSDSEDATAGTDVPPMRALPGIGLGIRGAALLGARRRLAVGGELWATGQPISSRTRPVLVSGAMGPTFEYAQPVARGRLELGAGGSLGLALQTLRYAGDAPPPCAVSDRGALSTRAGALLSGRFVLSVLLGERRNHELALRLSPGLAAFAPASRAADDDAQATRCSDLSTPFESLGLSGRAALVVMIDLGYAPRF